MKVLKKIFGGINLTWPKLIIFAVVIGVYTGLINQVPFLYDTSLRDLAICFDRWVLFGILIIMNSKSNVDSALKCFVFFLISQPLIYLVEVPFLGWSVMQYYRNWILWTILTLPMGFIGYYMKKDRPWGLIILAPMLLLVGGHYSSYFGQMLFSFPFHLYSVIFCAGTLVLYSLCIFSDKRVKLAALIISGVMIVGGTVYNFVKPPVYSTDILSSGGETAATTFDDSYKVYWDSDSHGDLSIRYEEATEDYLVHAELTHSGQATFTLEAPDGSKLNYDIMIERNTYEVTKK